MTHQFSTLLLIIQVVSELGKNKVQDFSYCQTDENLTLNSDQVNIIKVREIKCLGIILVEN